MRVAADDRDAIRSLIGAAARRYRPAGLSAYCFALGKLRFDPVFAALLRRAHIPNQARVLDLGCGQGLLFAWLLAAADQYRAGVWPADWPAPPQHLRLHGIERQERESAWGTSALGGRGQIETADLRQATFPPTDVVVLLDVLHYFDNTEQLALLQRAARSLPAQGRMLLRVTEVGPRLSFTLAADRAGALLRGHAWPRYHTRTVDEWRQLLDRLGFVTGASPMSAGTPFRNVLLVATRARS
jgi:cyclopropane fatty-acyl-phospholipid synthase-like methyltransferase